jgi:hypothetical protein
VVFVADDLGAWLVFVLAEAGRKKLTTLVLGSDQERALRQAAAATVPAQPVDRRPLARDYQRSLAAPRP